MGLALLLGACAAVPHQGELDPQAWPLPSLKDAPFKGRLERRLVLEKKGQGAELWALAELEGGRLTLVGLSPLGQRLLRCQWGPQGLSATAEVPLPEGLSPESPLRELVFAIWPSSSLNQSLAGSAWDMVEKGGKRSLRFKGKEILRVEPGEDGAQRLWHPHGAYSVTVSPLKALP